MFQGRLNNPVKTVNKLQLQIALREKEIGRLRASEKKLTEELKLEKDKNKDLVNSVNKLSAEKSRWTRKNKNLESSCW